VTQTHPTLYTKHNIWFCHFGVKWNS